MASDSVSDSSLEIKKGRGRPLGAKQKSAKFNHYKPQKWLPWMTELVVLNASGMSLKDLAERFGITPTHASNLNCTPHAHAIREGLAESLGEKVKKDIGSRLMRLQEKALSRVEDYLDKDHIFEKTPTEAVDRALKILSKGGLTSNIDQPEVVHNNTTIVNNNQVNLLNNLPAEVMTRMQEGLIKSAGMSLPNPSTPLDVNRLNVTPDAVRK